MKFSANLKSAIKKIIIFLLPVLVIFAFIRTSSYQKPLSYFENSVLRKCSGKGTVCYDSEIPKLMKNLSMEQVFTITSGIQKRDPTYAYCHVLGHKISSIETKKDVSKWKEVIGRCPSGVCSNGCVHGAFQERFRAEYFTDEELVRAKEELKDICEQRPGFNPTELERSSCYHALGHLFMYITNADIKKSINLCDENLKHKEFAGVCYDGAFMQIYQPLEAEDFALIKGKEIKKENMASFCKQFIGEVKTSCITESWPLYFDEITTPEGLNTFCNQMVSGPRRDCFNDMFYVLPIQFKFDLEYMAGFCRQMGENSRLCFASVASRIIEIDKDNSGLAANFCSKASSQDAVFCYGELVKISDFVFHKDSVEFEKLCLSMPEDYKNQCLQKR